MSPVASNGGYKFMQELLKPGCVALQGSAINTSSTPEDEGGCVNHAHGVTYNEVSKLFAMGYSYSGNRSHLQASLTAYELLSKFDMQVYGVNSGDEDMNGIGPNAATETCDISDFIYSNSWMLRVTGHTKFGDHLERAFYNAAPGAVNRSFSGHVYLQAPNLVSCPSWKREAVDLTCRGGVRGIGSRCAFHCQRSRVEICGGLLPRAAMLHWESSQDPSEFHPSYVVLSGERQRTGGSYVRCVQWLYVDDMAALYADGGPCNLQGATNQVPAAYALTECRSLRRRIIRSITSFVSTSPAHKHLRGVNSRQWRSHCSCVSQAGLRSTRWP